MQYDERNADPARLAPRQVRRLDLEVRDPSPRRLAAERARAADDRAGVLVERAPAGRRPSPAAGHRVGVEEDDDVAVGLRPAAVAAPPAKSG